MSNEPKENRVVALNRGANITARPIPVPTARLAQTLWHDLSLPYWPTTATASR
jgi:hypothetical protein